MTWLLRRVLALWVRYSVLPEDAAARVHGLAHAVCYVLEHRSVTDLAVLQNACVKLKLPRPRKRLLAQGRELTSFFYLSRPRGFWDERLDRRPPPELGEVVRLLLKHGMLDVDLVPVAVYWGRAPQREASWIRLLLVEEWAFASRLRKFFQVLFNGRDTLLQFGEAVSLRRLLDAAPADVQCRRVARAMRARYAEARAARIGPDLSHRRTIVAEVVASRAVRVAVAQEMREKNITRRQALKQARRLAQEIAANYSHAFVRFMERLLTWLWNRLYDGVVFQHVRTLEEATAGTEIIYVPCHRSHMDYLLLSYVIYRQGYAIPHIAGGINLNLPVIGRLLRKGGAFFIRRSFRGSALYTVVFTSYLASMMARGHPIEYFVEGGRSRTGRLLKARTGMISMTVRGFLRHPIRPLVFLPVYFGYERIMEGSTYIGELSGAPKEKESVFTLLATLPRLRERFGTVHVNLGEPIALTDMLERHAPGWRERASDEDTRSSWLAPVVDDIAGAIMRNINSAAAVTPVNLLAVALLASPRRTLAESDLLRQLELYLVLLRECPYSERVTVTPLSAVEIIAYGEKLGIVTRRRHPLGDLVQMSDEAAVLAAYYRNNVLHLIALPSLIACAFVGNAAMRGEDIGRLAWRIYPYVAAELFLRWREEELGAEIERVLQVLFRHRLIESSADGSLWLRPAPTCAEAVQLSLLAQATLQTIERYYLTIALLLKAGSGEITQAMLEERCQLMAQRMGLVYGFNSPEFFDRALFVNFIDLLRRRGVLQASGAGRLEFDQVLGRVAEDAQLVLNDEIRHSILQVTHA